MCDGSVTGGGGGVKISVFWRDVVYGCPLSGIEIGVKVNG